MSDTLDTLQKALTPKTGMRRIPFPTESYQHSSPPLSAKRLVNYYAEEAPTDARSQVVLMPTQGLVTWHNLDNGPIKAMNSDLPGRIYVVSGDRFYRITDGTTFEDLGSVGLSMPDVNGLDTYIPTIAVGPTAVVVCVPPNVWTADHTGPINQLGGTFPAEGASSVTYLDGYFVFTQAGHGGPFFICRLLDPTDFDALDFAYADAFPNDVRRVVTHRGELWFLGFSGFEVWYDSGDADFPFRRRAGGVTKHGTATHKSMAMGDDSVWWFGIDGNIYRSNGYAAVRVSTHAIEKIIEGLSFSTLVSALTYTQDGHLFYVMNFTGRSLAYDVATKQWADRVSGADGSRWRCNAVAGNMITPIFGDSLSGQLMLMAPGITELGVGILRQVTMPPLWAGTSRAFCHRLEIEMEVPAALLSVLVEWSDDGGTTWKGHRVIDVSAITAARRRVVTTRLGSFHERTFRLTMNGAAPVLYAVDADILGPPTIVGG